jgi:hypothetical protein
MQQPSSKHASVLAGVIDTEFGVGRRPSWSSETIPRPACTDQLTEAQPEWAYGARVERRATGPRLILRDVRAISKARHEATKSQVS